MCFIVCSGWIVFRGSAKWLIYRQDAQLKSQNGKIIGFIRTCSMFSELQDWWQKPNRNNIVLLLLPSDLLCLEAVKVFNFIFCLLWSCELCQRGFNLWVAAVWGGWRHSWKKMSLTRAALTGTDGYRHCGWTLYIFSGSYYWRECSKRRSMAPR